MNRDISSGILAIVLLIGAVIFFKNLPELRRYLRINSM